jgi:chlorite dismutase
MFGRTYGSGHEADLEHVLLQRPIERALDPKNQWAIWYPLRRSGAFAQLSAGEQGSILKEHGTIGRSYGDAGLVDDIRLACPGLDPEDNDFVLGLLGPELHPLSKVVGAMRGTRQTAEFITKLGPFFVGRKAYQHPAKAASSEPEPDTQDEIPAVGARDPDPTPSAHAVEPDTDADTPAPVDE